MESNWGQYPMLWRYSALSLLSDTSPMKQEPDVMISSPVTILNVVVFPAPLTPRRPKHSFFRTPNVRPRTAENFLNFFFRLTTLIMLSMKSFRVSALFLLIPLIGLSHSSKDVKQACQGSKDWLLCGDVCLKDGKNCTCGNSSFTVKWKTKPKSTEVCCSPEGSCIKDTNGKYLFLCGNIYSF